ncbi:carbon-nitrogen family hydrolase [Effusibacillus dendaii]|uniref:Hydrolase n=1 Tax=Effusibacillus dendaii TaxID=2743772 RepID=A0A7I8D9T3_9BACL|nr:carbon-nitrogen family hydrolase [Effusibacillus dendaii]BCJ86923.1 hydrolase [Effusibacillus dendaii]
MKLALVQMDVQIGEPEKNYQKAQHFLKEAMAQNPDMIIFPEMWNTGYALEQADEVADIDGKRTRELFSEFAKQHHVTIVGGSVLYKDSQSGDVTNTMLVFDEKGNEVIRYDKLHLFRLMDEHLYLKAGNAFGLFDYKGTTVGTMICYDLRFPFLFRKLVGSGAKLLINTAQWPSARVDHWRTLVISRAIENQSYMIAVNRCGTSRDTAFPGNSMVVDPWGEVLLEGDSNEQIYFVDIDLAKVDAIRKRIPVFDDQRFDLY